MLTILPTCNFIERSTVYCAVHSIGQWLRLLMTILKVDWAHPFVKCCISTISHENHINCLMRPVGTSCLPSNLCFR